MLFDVKGLATHLPRFPGQAVHDEMFLPRVSDGDPLFLPLQYPII